jgi:hypothetical protein
MGCDRPIDPGPLEGRLVVAPTGGLESLSASIVDGADQLDVEKNPIKRMCEAHAKQKK